ncbi:MAG: tetratricopeptide repeat protein [Polyangiaceae bacterium]
MKDRIDSEDHAHWDEVEEASELLHEERFQEALYLLRDVAKASPRNPYAYHFMAVALFELGQLEACRDAYRAALKLSPNYLGSRVGLSNVLRMLGDLRGAIIEGEAALRQSHEDGDAMYALGMAHAERGDREAAIHYLEKFLDTKPELEIAIEVRAQLERLGAGKELVDL